MSERSTARRGAVVARPAPELVVSLATSRWRRTSHGPRPRPGPRNAPAAALLPPPATLAAPGHLATPPLGEAPCTCAPGAEAWRRVAHAVQLDHTGRQEWAVYRCTACDGIARVHATLG